VARYSDYYTLRKSPQLILAGRAALGSLFGAPRDEIPALPGATEPEDPAALGDVKLP
jgi:hypothetical protein